MNHSTNMPVNMMNNTVTDYFILNLKKILNHLSNNSILKMVNIADKKMCSFAENYELYEFNEFWTKECTNDSQQQQRVTLHYLLIHATQNYMMKKLMHCYQNIKEKLKDGLINPIFAEMIRKDATYLPDDISKSEVKGWNHLRNETIGSEQGMEEITRSNETVTELFGDAPPYILYHDDPEKGKIRIGRLQLRTTKKGNLIRGVKTFMCEMIHWFYHFFLNDHDCNGMKVYKEDLIHWAERYFNIDLNNHYQLNTEAENKKWWQVMDENIKNIIQNRPDMLILPTFYYLSIL